MRMFKLSAFENDCNDLLPLWGLSHLILLCHDRCLPTTPKNTYRRLVKTWLFSSLLWFVRKSNIFTFVLAGLLLLSHGHLGSSRLRNINWYGALLTSGTLMLDLSSNAQIALCYWHKSPAAPRSLFFWRRQRVVAKENTAQNIPFLPLHLPSPPTPRGPAAREVKGIRITLSSAPGSLQPVPH